MVRVLILTIALLAVLTSSSEKQPVNCAAIWAVEMSQASQNLSHWQRNSAHCAGEHPMSIDGRLRAGGRTLERWVHVAGAGCSAKVWVMRSCAAACGSFVGSGSKDVQLATGHVRASAIFEGY